MTISSTEIPTFICPTLRLACDMMATDFRGIITLSRIHMLISRNRMFVINRTRNADNPLTPSETISMAGTTGNSKSSWGKSTSFSLDFGAMPRKLDLREHDWCQPKSQMHCPPERDMLQCHAHLAFVEMVLVNCRHADLQTY